MNYLIENPEALYGMLTGLAIIAAIAICKSFYKIEEGHLGAITTFGAADREPNSQKNLRLRVPGLHFKWPWQRVREFSMMERSTHLTSHSGSFHAMTSDGTLLKLESKLRIQPVRENLYTYLFELRDPVAHIQELFKCLLRNEIANFKDSYEGIRKERDVLNQKLSLISQSHIGTHYGVKFNSVDIVDILPPEELSRALNAVQNAQSLMATQYNRALADRDQRLESAKQNIEISKNRATAAAEEITVLGKALASLDEDQMLEEYIHRRRSEVYAGSKWSFINNRTNDAQRFA